MRKFFFNLTNIHVLNLFKNSHTVIIFIIIISFVFTVYGTSPQIGSIGTMYDLLVAASIRTPIVDNEQGSLVTMSSLQALFFG